MTRVAVLMGGWSPEREVSLVSGKACAEGLRDGGHEVVEYDVKRDLRALVDFLRPAGGGGPDVVFNALHGRYGECTAVQLRFFHRVPNRMGFVATGPAVETRGIACVPMRRPGDASGSALWQTT